MAKIWPKMYHLAAKILKIDPGVSKIEAKQDILKEATKAEFAGVGTFFTNRFPS